MPDQDDYQPRTWTDRSLFTSEQASDMSAQINENEEVGREHTGGIASLEAGADAFNPDLYMPDAFYACHAPAQVQVSNSNGDGTLRVVPWVVRGEIHTAGFAVEHTAPGEAGCTFRIDLYKSDAYGVPTELVYESAPLPMSGAAGVQLAAAVMAIPPGLYWAGGVILGAPTTQPTLRVVTNLLPIGPLAVGGNLPGIGVNHGARARVGVASNAPNPWLGTAFAAAAPRIFVKTAA